MPTVIITGASRGIGRAIAQNYARRNWNVVINGGHDRQALNRLEEELSKDSRILSCFGSVAEEDTAGMIFERTMETFGGIDLLINNAGIAFYGLLQDMTAKEWRNVIGSNLDSVFYMCRAVIPEMVRKKEGRILNVSSVWGEVGASMEAAYSASKGGVNALTKALAKELAPSGISVNAVSFGLIDTQMNARLSEEERADLMREIPAEKIAAPEEAAAFCCHIASAPSYLTGQVIRFDGGWI